MACDIRIGTSGFHYKHWKGPFYPEKMPADAMLDFYTQHFDTVELNNSFYRWQCAAPERHDLRTQPQAHQLKEEFSAPVLRSPALVASSFRRSISLTTDHCLPHTIPLRNSFKGYFVPRHSIPSFHKVRIIERKSV